MYVCVCLAVCLHMCISICVYLPLSLSLYIYIYTHSVDKEVIAFRTSGRRAPNAYVICEGVFFSVVGLNWT